MANDPVEARSVEAIGDSLSATFGTVAHAYHGSPEQKTGPSV